MQKEKTTKVKATCNVQAAGEKDTHSQQHNRLSGVQDKDIDGMDDDKAWQFKFYKLFHALV